MAVKGTAGSGVAKPTGWQAMCTSVLTAARMRPATTRLTLGSQLQLQPMTAAPSPASVRAHSSTLVPSALPAGPMLSVSTGVAPAARMAASAMRASLR